MDVWTVVLILVVVLVVLVATRMGDFMRGFRRGARAYGTSSARPAPPPPPPPPVVERPCPACGALNPEGQAFCGQCGVRIDRAA